MHKRLTILLTALLAVHAAPFFISPQAELAYAAAPPTTTGPTTPATPAAPTAPNPNILPNQILALAPCALGEANLATANDPRQGGLRPCTVFMGGEQGSLPFLTQLKTVVQQNVERLSKANHPTGTRSCGLVPNPLILKDGAPISEEKTNRFGQSCGDPMKLTFKTSPLVVQFHKEYVAGRDVPIGSLEDSWLYGAQYQAVAYYLNEVSTEIQKERKLTIRPYSQGASYSLQMARDYMELLEARNNLFSIVAARPGSKGFLQATQDCKKAQTETATAGDSFDVGVQAAGLCATRMSLERAFLNLAVTEVMGRASDSYLTQIGSADAKSRMYQWIRDTMKMVCKDAQDSGEANRCYQQNVGPKMRDYLRGIWPIQAQAVGPSRTVAQAELAMPWLLLAVAARRTPSHRNRKKLAKSKRRRPIAAKRRKAHVPIVITGARRLLRLLGFSAGILAAVIVTTSCNSGVDQNTPTELLTGAANGVRCPYGFPQYKIECCTADGTLNTQICSDPNTLLDDPLKGSITNGADDIYSGAGSLDNARALLGVSREAIDPKFGGGLALLAGRGTNTADPAMTPETTPSAAPAAAATAARAPAGPGDTGNLGPSSSSASIGASGGALPAFAPEKGEGTTYAGGGAPPAAGAEPDTTGFFGDLNTGASREPGAAGAAFAQKDGPATRGSADPEDYFTRVSLDESIFKIVTRRYRIKATSWATAQAQANFEGAQTAARK